MKFHHTLLGAMLLAACSGADTSQTDEAAPAVEPAPAESVIDKPVAEIQAVKMFMLDCGLIEISDLDIFSTEGDYAGQTDTFTDTCWLVRHPEGDLLWDLGLPTGLVGEGKQENGIFTISLERTLSDQLAEIGMFASDVELISISHSHFDHSGQADQFPDATWLVNAEEYAVMFPGDADEGDSGADGDEGDDANANPYIAFADIQRREFSGELDVFEDGTVRIIPTPGHTPGHTSLLVTLPESGPILLTGDLYHRNESRELQRVPSFNADVAQTRASMAAFEALAEETGAKVVIQHEPEDAATLPKSPDPIR